jgi:filamentous hemagglutinin family protein
MMNSVYRLVWIRRLNIFIVAPENARSSGKASGLKAISAAVLAAISFSAYALPEGGVVISGAEIKPVVDNTLTIVQQSQKASISWQKFSTTAAESIIFEQPSSQSIILNRVIGNEPSSLLGKMTANGQVWLLNPNGVLFGSGATVNVGGLLATSLFISDKDFTDGKYNFTGVGGSVVNRGTITVGVSGSGGYAALLGGIVSNESVIAAKLGTVVLAGGSDMTLDFSGDKLLSARVDKGVVNALAQNKQLISADGGTVIMTAQGVNALLSTVVNNEGTIEARTLSGTKGKMSLLGGKDGGRITVSGKLDASSDIGVGDGGQIELSGSTVKITEAATITAASSSSLTKNGLLKITASDFAITSVNTANESGMSAAALKKSLANQDVNINTDSFGNVAAGDIHINDAISWSTENTLTLNAARHLNVNAAVSNSGATASLILNAINNININANISSTGAAAALTIKPGTSAGDGYWLKNSAKINLPTGANVKIADQSYKVINTLEALQNVNDDLLTNYVLGSDINASSTKTLNDGAGFVPIGNQSKPFKGNFDGFGHQISDLSINRPFSNESVGLFSYTNSANILRNIRLTNVDVKGKWNVGGLIGTSFSNIANVFVSGIVYGSDTVGGLTGYSSGSLENISADVNVSGYSVFGGLIGYSDGNVNNVSVNGSVTGLTADSSYAGGLAGVSTGLLTNAIVNSQVTGKDYVGLIVGETSNSMTNIYATGKINGQSQSDNLLVGNDRSIFNNGTLTNLKALSADNFKKKESFTGLDFVNVWRIYEGNTVPLLRSFLKPVTVSADSVIKSYDKNSYTDELSGIKYSVDGAILEGKLTYEGGSELPVNAGIYEIGGLWSTSYDINYGPGKLTILPKELRASLAFNPTKKYDGTTTAKVVLSSRDITGFIPGEEITAKGTEFTGVYNSKNVKEARTVEVVLNSDSAIAASGTQFSNYKLIVDGTITPAELSVKAKPITKTYDGSIYSGAELIYTGFMGLDNETALDGTLTYGGTAQGVKNVGSYDITARGLSSSNYTISFEAATLTINSKILTASVIGKPTKSYDGTANAKIVLNNLKLNGLADGEQIEALGTNVTGLYNSKNVSEANSVSIKLDTSNFKFNGGAQAANYKILAIDGEITQAGLKIQAVNDIKIYSGSAYSGGNGVTSSGFVNSETNADLSGAISYSGDAQGAKNAGIYSIMPEGLSSTNYLITLLPGSLTIQPKVLNASAVRIPSKIYDGNADATVELIDRKLAGLVNGESINAKNNSVNGVYNSKNASEANTVTVGLNTDSFDFGGNAQASNYQLVFSGAKIHPAALTIKVNSANKTYDGLAYLGGSGITYSGFANGETASVLSGTVVYSGTAQGAKNVGEYVITAAGLSTNNYSIGLQPGTLKIEPKVLTASVAATPTKVYDGTANAKVELSDLQLTGFVNNEFILAKTIKLSGVYKSKNVSDTNPVTVSLTSDNFTASEGTQLSNYILQSNNGKITPTKLTIKPNNVVKYFDGLPYSGADLNYAGFVNGETPAVLDGALSYSGSAQGATNPGRYAIIANGLTSSNYTINYLPARLSIEPDLYTLAKLGQPVNTFAGKPGPANSKYTLRNSSPTNDSSLIIECKQLNNVRSGSVQCAGSVNGAANTISPPLPAAGAACKSCLPSKLSIASSNSSTN